MIMSCDLCGKDVQWNPEFWDKIKSRGIENFKELEKEIKASVIRELESTGVSLMLNPDGSPHNCKTIEELNIGEKIQVLVKNSELIEEYIFLGIVQFSNFSPKFFKLKKGDRKIYIQVAEIQKIYH